jgi:hypothetical protein
MLIGILEQYAVLDRASYELFLDRLMVDTVMSMVFPCIQLGLDVNDRAAERLITCIDSGGAPLHSYRNLGHMTVVSRIDRDRLLSLLVALKHVENGDFIIIDSLALLISNSGSDQLPIPFLDLAREIMGRQVFSRSKPIHLTLDYELARIAQACFSGDEGADITRIVSTNLLEGIHGYSVSAYLDYPRLMDALATCQPAIFLDVFLGRGFEHQGMIGRVFDSASWHDDLGHSYNSLGLIENRLLLDWCESGPDHRFSALAEAAHLCSSTTDETGRPELLWSPLALELLSKAPNTTDILKAFESVFFPRSWTGSRSDVIEERLPLLYSLEQHPNPAVAAWASAKRTVLTHYVAELRLQEDREQSTMSQRFE